MKRRWDRWPWRIADHVEVRGSVFRVNNRDDSVSNVAVKRFLKSLGAFLIAVGLLELTAQAIKINLLPPKWYKIDATSRLDPKWPVGKTIDYADIVKGRGARLGTLNVNSLGFRGKERRLSDERAPGRLRVYCLGSSTTFGWGATTDGATYPAQLEEYLKMMLPKLNVEVINAGVPGNSSNDELKILEADLVALKPDIVVICSGWPDWSHYVMPPPTANTQQGPNAFRRVDSAFGRLHLRGVLARPVYSAPVPAVGGRTRATQRTGTFPR